MSPREMTNEQLADAISTKWIYYPEITGDLRDEAARRLRAAAGVQEGYIRDDKGVARKVLGTLPMTADGCVVGFNSVIWHCDDQININGCRPYCCGSKCWSDGFQGDSGDGRHHKPEACYSTREAAEAASKAVQDG